MISRKFILPYKCRTNLHTESEKCAGLKFHFYPSFFTDVATNDLNLLSPTGREAFVADCNHETLNVECIDDSIDLCANGHHLYGFSTITCVALPGILFGLSDFLNFKGFSLGRMLGNPFLRRWPMIFKVLVLPLYMILMVPLVIFITSYK